MNLKTSLQAIALKLEAVPLSAALKTISEVKVELESIISQLPEDPLVETLPLFPDEETPQ